MAFDVSVDHDKCASSGACVLEEPGAFGWQEGEGLAIVLPGVADLDDERIVEVARLCPMDAIVVKDGEATVAP
jgi:ferredoxin